MWVVGGVLYAVYFCMYVYFAYVWVCAYGLMLNWVCVVVGMSVCIAKISLGNSHERHYFLFFVGA